MINESLLKELGIKLTPEQAAHTDAWLADESGASAGRTTYLALEALSTAKAVPDETVYLEDHPGGDGDSIYNTARKFANRLSEKEHYVFHSNRVTFRTELAEVSWTTLE